MFHGYFSIFFKNLLCGTINSPAARCRPPAEHPRPECTNVLPAEVTSNNIIGKTEIMPDERELPCGREDDPPTGPAPGNRNDPSCGEDRPMPPPKQRGNPTVATDRQAGVAPSCDGTAKRRRTRRKGRHRKLPRACRYMFRGAVRSSLIASMCSAAQAMRPLICGNNDRARSVKAYSTRGGTSGQTFRVR